MGQEKKNFMDDPLFEGSDSTIKGFDSSEDVQEAMVEQVAGEQIGSDDKDPEAVDNDTDDGAKLGQQEFVGEFVDDEKDPVMPQGVPNVRLAKSREADALPAGLCNIGMDSIMIPTKATQLKGFYAPSAGVLVAQFPQYKFHQVKGQANDKSIELK